jgi:hypothetical protein
VLGFKMSGSKLPIQHICALIRKNEDALCKMFLLDGENCCILYTFFVSLLSSRNFRLHTFFAATESHTSKTVVTRTFAHLARQFHEFQSNPVGWREKRSSHCNVSVYFSAKQPQPPCCVAILEPRGFNLRKDKYSSMWSKKSFPC